MSLVSQLKYVSRRHDDSGNVVWRVQVPGFTETTCATAKEVKTRLGRLLGTKKLPWKARHVKTNVMETKVGRNKKPSVPELIARIGKMVPLGDGKLCYPDDVHSTCFARL